jgi:hypothetical protein
MLVERKRRTARVVLAIMAGMAAMTLVFALMTNQWRRDHDFKYKSNTPVHLAEEPSRLAGLGWLPKGCNVAVAVHVAQLMEDDAGLALLREPRPALLGQLLTPLAATGLTLAHVDHIIAGSELKDLSFRVTTVIVTRKPYDAAQLKQAVEQHKVKAATYRNCPLYHFTERPGTKLWCADARVLVYTSLPTEDMERIAGTVKDPADRLTPIARDALTARLDKQSRIWAVGDLEPARDLIDALQLFAGPLKEQASLLTLVRAFDVGITVGAKQSITVASDFYTGNPKATQELRKYLEGTVISGAKSQKVETPPADLHAAEAQWVSWQLRGDVDALREAIGKLGLGTGKKPAQ